MQTALKTIAAVKRLISQTLTEDSMTDTQKIEEVYKAYNYIFKRLYDLDLDVFFNVGGEGGNLKYTNNRNIIFKYPLGQILVGMDVERQYLPQPVQQLTQVLDHLQQHDKYYTTLKQTEKQLLNNGLEVPSLSERKKLSNKFYNRLKSL